MVDFSYRRRMSGYWKAAREEAVMGTAMSRPLRQARRRCSRPPIFPEVADKHHHLTPLALELRQTRGRDRRRAVALEEAYAIRVCGGHARPSVDDVNYAGNPGKKDRTVRAARSCHNRADEPGGFRPRGDPRHGARGDSHRPAKDPHGWKIYCSGVRRSGPARLGPGKGAGRERCCLLFAPGFPMEFVVENGRAGPEEFAGQVKKKKEDG